MLAVPMGLLGLVITLQITAAQAYKRDTLSSSAPSLYFASLVVSFVAIGYLVFRRSGLNRVDFYILGICSLALLVLAVLRGLQIVVVDWGSV
jgi:hypothetical protein